MQENQNNSPASIPSRLRLMSDGVIHFSNQLVIQYFKKNGAEFSEPADPQYPDQTRQTVFFGAYILMTPANSIKTKSILRSRPTTAQNGFGYMNTIKSITYPVFTKRWSTIN